MIMSTATTSSTASGSFTFPPLLSDAVRHRVAYTRQRPTTVAAEEFFADSIGTPSVSEWKSLPQRIDRLCQVLDQWVSLVI
jgi:hypothetical protein